MVSLLYDNETASFMSMMRNRFYAKRIAEGRIKADALLEVMFESKPASGAAILRPAAGAL